MLNKTLLLTALSLGSICSANIPVVDTNTSIEVKQDDQDYESCTMMYVGKQVSADGKAIIARSADSTPRAMNLNLAMFKHNELANKTVKSRKGFEWKMPDTTYRYISTPRNPHIGKGLHWEASAINENGVCITATLSCYANEAAQTADKYVDTGLGEDNITQIGAAVGVTAKQTIEYLANVIKSEGAEAANAIMVQDQNESWYMEIYTGHQYCAIKMPDNKITTIGNEFLLNTLSELNLKEGEYIVSNDLFKLAHDHGFAKPLEATKVEDLNLFDTYAEDLIYADEAERRDIDDSHRRTWVGWSMFAPNSEYGKEYVDADERTDIERTKYPAFFEPEFKLTTDDVISFMRNRFENTAQISKGVPSWDPTLYEDFNEDYESGALRYVGTETAYQIHILKSDPDLPKEFSADEWICFANANYAPFVVLNSGCNDAIDYYLHESEQYGYDDKSAVSIYKKLDTLADLDRYNHGIYIQDMWHSIEDIWQNQWLQIKEGIKDKKASEARQIVTNYCKQVQTQAINLAKYTTTFLEDHIMEEKRSVSSRPVIFTPYLDIQNYSRLYGWSYKYDKSKKIVTLTQGKDTVTINCNYVYTSLGKTNTKLNKNGTEYEVRVTILDGKPYMWMNKCWDFLGNGYEMPKLNVNDYFNKSFDNRHLAWIIPLAILVPAGIIGGIVGGITYTNKKKKKVATA